MAHMAMRCNSCAFGSKADQCVKCGGPFGKELAYLCDNCSFGSKGDECVMCGNPFAKSASKLCSQCAFGSSKKCLKCDKYI